MYDLITFHESKIYSFCMGVCLNSVKAMNLLKMIILNKHAQEEIILATQQETMVQCKV